MKRLAFVIGISDYEYRKKLNNAVKDATDIAQALESLKYEVIPLLDCTFSVANTKFYDVANKLIDGYDSVVFYFAGHGEIINGEDCLLMKDAPLCESYGDIRPRAHSIAVNKIMKEFNIQGDQKNILIIDACRLNSDSDARGAMVSEKTTVFSKLPYQTFIAFSTSPGDSAKDGMKGTNSPFAKSLLSHIHEENLDIEFLFKKVRNDIKQAGYSQYPWEHTCLLDSFCFNYGQLSPYYGRRYDKEAFKRSEYTPAPDSIESEIINKLDSGDSIEQGRAFGMLIRNHRNLTCTQKFHLGRVVYKRAADGSSQCKQFLSKVSNLELMKTGDENHLLRGVYYEIYFNENDELRDRPYGDTEMLTDIESMRSRIQDKDSENFVMEFLPKDDSTPLYLLGKTELHKFHLILRHSDLMDSDWKNILQAEDIRLSNKSILPALRDKHDNLLIDWTTLRSDLSDLYGLPLQKIRINSNIAKDGAWDTISLADELPDFHELLFEVCRESTPDEVDTLSSLSYIDDIEDYTVSEIYQEEDYFTIKGNLNASIHLEYDGEDAGNISFPGTYTLYLIKDAHNHLSLQLRESRIHIDTEKFYR